MCSVQTGDSRHTTITPDITSHQKYTARNIPFLSASGAAAPAVLSLDYKVWNVCTVSTRAFNCQAKTTCVAECDARLPIEVEEAPWGTPPKGQLGARDESFVFVLKKFRTLNFVHLLKNVQISKKNVLSIKNLRFKNKIAFYKMFQLRHIFFLVKCSQIQNNI